MADERIAQLDAERIAERDRIIHRLRSRGWSRMDAENEADDRTDHYIVRIQELMRGPDRQRSEVR